MFVCLFILLIFFLHATFDLGLMFFLSLSASRRTDESGIQHCRFKKKEKALHYLARPRFYLIQKIGTANEAENIEMDPLDLPFLDPNLQPFSQLSNALLTELPGLLVIQK